jgi:cold shock CspA family protein
MIIANKTDDNQEEREDKRYIIVPNSLFKPEYTNDDRIIFGKLMLYARNKGFAWITDISLSKDCFCSTSTVSRAIKKFKKNNLIKVSIIKKDSQSKSTWERRIAILISSISDDINIDSYQHDPILKIASYAQIDSNRGKSQSQRLPTPNHKDVRIIQDTNNNSLSTKYIENFELDSDRSQENPELGRYFHIDSITRQNTYQLKKYPNIYLSYQQLKEISQIYKDNNINKKELNISFSKCNNQIALKEHDRSQTHLLCYKYLTGYLLEEAMKVSLLKPKKQRKIL